jgi:hypothetical protein
LLLKRRKSLGISPRSLTGMLFFFLFLFCFFFHSHGLRISLGSLLTSASSKEHVRRFGKLLEENIKELASTLTAQTGKPIQQATGEVKGIPSPGNASLPFQGISLSLSPLPLPLGSGTIGRVNWMLDNVEKAIAPRIAHQAGHVTEKVTREPLV